MQVVGIISEKQLSFAGSDPVAYDEDGFKMMRHSATNDRSDTSGTNFNDDVIREVTEPTSPDPYYP